MTPEIQALQQKFCNNTVFLIGGGPSAGQVESNQLNGKNVMCLNSSYKYFDSCDAILWCDSSWASKNEESLKQHSAIKLGCLSYAKKNSPTTVQKTIGDSTVLFKTGSSGFDPNIMCVKGNNSGTMALNLLMNMRVKTVILIGFDMDSTSRQSHFHKDYDFVVNKNIYTDMFIPNFSEIIESSKQYNVRTNILNASYSSRLQLFKKVNLEDYI